MAIDFAPLRETMAAKKISWYRLQQEGIDNKTIHKLRHNENITIHTLSRLCDIIDCEPEEIIRRIPR